jgi:hypothetical protein
MNNLIYQYYLPYKGHDKGYNDPGKRMPRWAEIGIDSARKYADSIGVKYILSDQPYMNSSINAFESFRLIFDKSFDQYDNILLLDVDMIVNTRENIFDLEVGDIAMVHEYGVTKRPAIPEASFDKSWWNNWFYNPSKGKISYASRYLDPTFIWKKSKLYPNEPFALYNGGLQLWTKQGRLKARSLFKRQGHEHFRSVTGGTETPYLTMMLMHHQFDVTELPIEWNKLNFQWKVDGDPGKITHFNDKSKPAMLKYLN